MTPHDNTLIIITGATGSGKTALAIELAEKLGCEIISADSRQLFRDIPIGTAAPTPEQQARVRHHFVGTLALDEYYSAARFEEDVLNLLPHLWAKKPYVIMCGGSVMYIDAIVNGIDQMPSITPQVRQRVIDLRDQIGDEGLRALLEITDPNYYKEADLANTKRVMHALEVSMQAGVPYSTLRTGHKTFRPFRILEFAIDMPRDELFNRINKRVNAMIDAGLIEEARKVYIHRHLNSLNTVGYKELFEWLDGNMDYESTIARIAKHTRVYAKKQLTLLKKRPYLQWLAPSTAIEQLITAIKADAKKQV